MGTHSLVPWSLVVTSSQVDVALVTLYQVFIFCIVLLNTFCPIYFRGETLAHKYLNSGTARTIES